MDKLGLSMKIPEKMTFSGISGTELPIGPNIDENGNTLINEYVLYTSNYIGSDPSLFGTEGLVIDVRFYPYGGNFTELEGNQGLRYFSASAYTQRGYEAYDRGHYILAIKQGIDYPISGSAWIVENDNESISIRVESKDDTGIYAINIRANNFDRGFSLGIDGYKDKRIQIGREIFNSIQ